MHGEDYSLQKKSDDDLRVRGVFDSNLPNTERKYSLKFVLNPHFGDFHRYNHLRIPMGLRYGMSERWEVQAEVESYIPHGLGNGAEGSETGILGYRFSSKFHEDLFPNYDWDQVVGFDFSSPLAQAPVEITDGLTHFRPYLNFARYSERNPRRRFFWGVGLDIANESKFDGRLRKNAIGESANTFRWGSVWEGDEFTYTFEVVYATSRFLGELDRDRLVVRPGIIWRVPRSHTFNSRGNWILGGALKSSYGRNGFDLGVSLKIKINLDFKDGK